MAKWNRTKGDKQRRTTYHTQNKRLSKANSTKNQGENSGALEEYEIIAPLVVTVCVTLLTNPMISQEWGKER